MSSTSTAPFVDRARNSRLRNSDIKHANYIWLVYLIIPVKGNLHNKPSYLPQAEMTRISGRKAENSVPAVNDSPFTGVVQLLDFEGNLLLANNFPSHSNTSFSCDAYTVRATTGC